MISPEEIRTVSFEKNMRGYRCDDVDDFLQQVAQDMEDLAGQVELLKKQKDESDQKLYILAQKIEEYRGEEDTLKTALLNAQRMGENVIREAKQKAESILRDANIKAEDLTHSAREQVEEYSMELERVQAEVAHFKASVLGLYKQHIESLSTLPGEEQEEEQPQEKPEPMDEEPVKEPEREAEPFAPQPMMADPSPTVEMPELFATAGEPVAPQPAAEEDLVNAVNAWSTSFDGAPSAAVEDSMTVELPPQGTTTFGMDFKEAPQSSGAVLPDGFQGIKFSD